MHYTSSFLSALSDRLLILDGAMGTLLQQKGCSRACLETLNVESPQIIEEVHLAYLHAGADIITTNTFSANRISLTENGLSDDAYDLALKGAQIARKVVDQWNATRKTQKFVAGSMGPTGISLTLTENLSANHFDEMVVAYEEQSSALIKGGVDVLLLETCFDTLNTKAACVGARRAMQQLEKDVPLWISFTVSDLNGRLLSGPTIEEYCNIIASMSPTIISMNCGWGAAAMVSFIERLSKVCPCYIGVYPNAGLPNEFGEYSQTPQIMVEELSTLLKRNLLNIVGGCCGTTPQHIAVLREYIVENSILCKPCPNQKTTSVHKFTIVGERCNVLGSKKFANLIESENYEAALEIARDQILKGADVIDINLDAPLINTKEAIIKFLKLFSSEPSLVGKTLMIDSSDWSVIQTAIRNVQGRVIVNSVSLKEGEVVFLERAAEVMDFGADLVVMAADENGQAITYERRMEVCRRAYKLLTEQLKFPAKKIIFDPNMLAVCTGVIEHANYAADFLKTTSEIIKTMPGVHVIAGVSNLSFAFRGANALREAMHAVFLKHAKIAGMDMAIINPASDLNTENIAPKLHEILDRIIKDGVDLANELTDWADILKRQQNKQPNQKIEVDNSTPTERIQQAIIKGHGVTLQSDIESLLSQMQPLDIISGPVMSAMERVGNLFAEGNMFLPQVLKSAKTMKEIVEQIESYIPNNQSNEINAPLAILATVKGDVHDIGKNICATILRCNGFRVVDLGVMVETQEIVNQAKLLQPNLIGISGLITPSLAHMIDVATQLELEKMNIPLFIGGATTSAKHTARFIAPHYTAPVVWTNDASQLALVAVKLQNSNERPDFIKELKSQQQSLQQKESDILSLDEARNNKLHLTFN